MTKGQGAKNIVSVPKGAKVAKAAKGTVKKITAKKSAVKPSKAKKRGKAQAAPRLENRKARHRFRIEKELEAGMCLTGSEVKSLRSGQASLSDSFAFFKEGELFLMNCHIGAYAQAVKGYRHTPKRLRKLLLHKREIKKLIGAVQRDGMTLVPLAVFFNARGFAKVMLGLGKGIAKADRRADIAERDWRRRKTRLTRRTLSRGEG